MIAPSVLGVSRLVEVLDDVLEWLDGFDVGLRERMDIESELARDHEDLSDRDDDDDWAEP